MSIVLDGTAGITSPGGDTATVSVATPILKSPSSLTLQTNGSTTALTVTTGQKVGVGTTAPISKLTVIGSGGFDGADATYSGTIQIADDVASAQAVGGLEFKSSSFGSGYGWKLCNIDPGGGTPLTLNYRDNSATWTEGFRFKSGGNFILKGGSTTPDGVGITFPATQAASSDANTLDDYEEGTWTPAVDFGGGAVGITFATRSGYYTKIGSLVNLYCYVYLSNKGSSVGTAHITGFPFNNGGGTNQYAASAMWAASLTSTGQVFAYSDPSSTQVVLVSISSVTGAQTAVSNTNFANNTEVMINITYRTV